LMLTEDKIVQSLRTNIPHRVGHILPTERVLRNADPYTVIFLHRDPRDIIPSWLAHCRKRWMSSPLMPLDEDSFKASEDKILWLIENLPPFYFKMMEWTKRADYIVRYEDLIDDPMKTLHDIIVDLDIDYKQVNHMRTVKNRFYRRGGKGHWKLDFEPHHVEAFNRIWYGEA